jgi:hypothetical protein
MARKYDWEAHITPAERVALHNYDINMAPARDVLNAYQAAKDAIRRKAVGRARNAEMKLARAALREKG